MSIADTSQGTKDVTQEYRDKGILHPVDPEAPTPKTRLPWLVKVATFDQLSLTLALMEEQGYTPAIVCPGGMIPDSRPGGGSVWSAVGYTVCGRLRDAAPQEAPLAQQLREATAAHVMTPPVEVPIAVEKAPSLPVQPRGKGKK